MRVNILGNGDNAGIFQRGTEGKLLVCNMPPFELTKKEVFATVMVDFKMMKALTEGKIKLDMYDWILGTRPRKWMELRGDFYLRYAPNVKAFYQHVPKYAAVDGNPAMAATNFNCGHMAAHYVANKIKADEIHMYGFDSLFDMNLKSYTDLVLQSDRGAVNNVRLNDKWRPIWMNIFKEFKDTKWVLHHNHDELKFTKGDNVEIFVH